MGKSRGQWLPGALVRVMRDIEEVSLCGGDESQAAQLAAFIDAIDRVRCTRIDPCWVCRPQGNSIAALVFKGGYFVPWDPGTWSIALQPELVFPWGFHGP